MMKKKNVVGMKRGGKMKKKSVVKKRGGGMMASINHVVDQRALKENIPNVCLLQKREACQVHKKRQQYVVRAAGNPGGKPTNVKTFVSKKTSRKNKK